MRVSSMVAAEDIETVQGNEPSSARTLAAKPESSPITNL